MKYCYINEENFQYFKPLLQEDQQNRMMSDPSIFGLGCYDKDTACGIIMYTMDEDLMTLRILYVAVSLSYQGKGVATDMIKSLADNAYEQGYITLANFFAKDSNDPRYAMFDNTDEFTIEQMPGGVYSMSSDKLKEVVYKIPPVEYDKKTSGIRTTISNSPGQTKNQIYESLKASGLDMAQMKPFIDEDLSYAVIGKEGTPTGMVVISHYAEQHLYELSYITAVERDTIADLYNIMVYAVSDTSDRMGPQDILRFSTAVESVDRLAQKYFSEDLKTERFYRAGYDGETVG